MWPTWLSELDQLPRLNDKKTYPTHAAKDTKLQAR